MKKDHDGKTDLSRRNVLLGGTTLAAASAIASTGIGPNHASAAATRTSSTGTLWPHAQHPFHHG